MKIWLISDTHGKHGELEIPKGIDMVIHAGDGGTSKNPIHCALDYRNFLAWYHSLDIEYKVMINGNHDTCFELGVVTIDEIPESIIYLEDEAKVIAGIKFYGSPQTPFFLNWAYNIVPEEIGKYWNAIPEDTEILITHGPAKGILDRCDDGYRAGCPDLLKKIKVIKPKLHVFGHIHEDGGKQEDHNGVTHVNASILNLSYQKSNNGIIIDY